jgi:hypothetical protein
MNTTVEGSNSADAFSPLDGGAGILLLRLEAVVWAGVSTDILLPAWVVFGVFLVRGLCLGFSARGPLLYD